jgi:hypothetical protein
MSAIQQALLAYGGASGPTDPFFSNVVALLHFNGTNGSTTFTDQKGHTFNSSSGTAISTTQSKFGGASVSPGSNANATLNSNFNTDWDMGTGDFCSEGWAYNSDVTTLQVLTANRIPSGGADRGPIVLVSAGGIRGFCGGTTGTAFADTGMVGTVPASTWFHWAWTRSGTSFRLFLNGTQVGSTLTSSTSCGSGADLQIGFDPGTTGRQWKGYIDDFRLTKGQARYTSNFSVPTAAFPNS